MGHAVKRSTVVLAAVSLGLAAVGSSPLRAEPDERHLEAAATLFHQGRYEAAAREAEDSGLAAGLAFAARATLASATVGKYVAPPFALYERAEALARRAIALDSGNAEAYRLLAIALGEIARRESPLTAFANGYASEARALIRQAMALEPRSPWVHAVLGGWHTEIVAAAGPTLARSLYGATVDEAVAAFDRAVELAPENVILRFEKARALARLDRPDEELAAALADAVERAANGAFERTMRDRAIRARSAMQRGDRAAALRALSPFGPWTKPGHSG